MKAHLSPLPIQTILTDAHLKAIGLTIVQWASLERLMVHALCHLIRGDNRPYVDDPAVLLITSGMEGRTLYGLLKTLVLLRFEADHKEFTKLIDKIESASKQRHVYAHAVWRSGGKPDGVRPLQMKTVGSVRMTEGELTPRDITMQARHFYNLGVTLAQFFQKRGLLLEEEDKK